MKLTTIWGTALLVVVFLAFGDGFWEATKDHPNWHELPRTIYFQILGIIAFAISLSLLKPKEK